MTERRALLTINFAFDSYEILPDSYPLLDNIAGALQDERMRGAFAEINGHTDVTGRFGYNMALSYLRAKAVMNYLAARGVPWSVMRAQGFGPLQLLDTAVPTDPANRRVEIVAVGP
jgi:OOP family OmpA-OmpF porin